MDLGHLDRFYPERAVGGFTSVDGTVAFYHRVQALLLALGTDSVVLDFGAGRGAFLDDPVAYRRSLRFLRGGAAKVVGIDVDSAVLTNEALDEAYVTGPGVPLPLDDRSVDLIVSDYTFEHIVTPGFIAAELDRVLRPGGWICARTPNRSGYIGLLATAVPNALHCRFLRRLQPFRKPEDVFPTAYRLNTRRDIVRHFPPDRFELHLMTLESEPAYVGRSQLATMMMIAVAAMTPRRLRSMLHIFLRKSLELPNA